MIQTTSNIEHRATSNAPVAIAVRTENPLNVSCGVGRHEEQSTVSRVESHIHSRLGAVDPELLRDIVLVTGSTIAMRIVGIPWAFAIGIAVVGNFITRATVFAKKATGGDSDAQAG